MVSPSEKIINEGKTKYILEVPGDPAVVDIEAKIDITAFDDPKYTKQFEMKAQYATSTTCRVFELLRAAGIPVAYREQISPTRFRADKCEMLKLEVVARRFAVGSYLKRHPELWQEPPYRFPRLEVEFFLKTTDGGFVDRHSEFQDLELGEEDPLIVDPNLVSWTLVYSKKPAWEYTGSFAEIWAREVVDEAYDENDQIILIKQMEEMTRKTFLVLEKVWAMMDCRFIDFKIEFGLTQDGRLVVADVIDNDSWRLRNQNWQELSKQAFRDGEALDQVELKYGYVADLLERFRVPEQALVVWQGSVNDIPPLAREHYESIPGIAVEELTLSGHKQTGRCLITLDELQGLYHFGVILVNVGMSNGLGPILAAHTTWPVIGLPATADKFPDDIWSNLRLPSQTPMMVCLEKNAVGAVRNILAQQNPVIYMQQQLAIEELDC